MRKTGTTLFCFSIPQLLEAELNDTIAANHEPVKGPLPRAPAHTKDKALARAIHTGEKCTA